MRSASNVNAREKRQKPLAGLKDARPSLAQPKAAHLASLKPEGRYSVFYKAQLRVAVMDDYASFSGGVHKYADHVVTLLVQENAREPINGFSDAWVTSPDAASHPFHGRNLRNFFGGKDSAHAVWAVLDLYIKLTQPKLAAGFRLDGYLERLGLTVAEFAGPYGDLGNIPRGLWSARGAVEEVYRDFVALKPLPGRTFGLAKLIRQQRAPENMPQGDRLSKLEDARTAQGVGVIIPIRTGFALVVKDPDTDDLLMGQINSDVTSLTALGHTGAQSSELKPATETSLPPYVLNNWIGESA